MCEIMTISAALGAVGAIGSMVQGQQQAAQASASANASTAQAGYLARKATWDRARRSEQNMSQVGSALAQRAGAGTTLSGSAVDGLLNNLLLTRADEMDGEIAGRMASVNAQASGNLSAMQGTAALTGAGFGATSSLLSAAQRLK